MALRSRRFAGDPALEAAAARDSAHIQSGASGPHVSKIQTALNDLDGAALSADGRYGPRTAAAVLAFKTARNIINTAYQTAPDAIVGRLTMAALDRELVAFEAQGDTDPDADIAAAIAAVIARMDQMLAQRTTGLSPPVRLAFEAVRAEALALAEGAAPAEPQVAHDLRRGLHHMDRYAPGRQPVVVFAAVPLVAAGAALTAAEIALITAILALAAILLLCAISEDFRKKAEGLKSAILDAGTKVIVENIADVEVISHAVDICRRSANTTNPKCIDALKRFDAKKADIVVKRGELQEVLKRLASKVTSIFSKRDGELAIALTRELARLMSELKDIVAEIMNECGCRFLGRLVNKPVPVGPPGTLTI